jgi:hypothetical protein
MTARPRSASSADQRAAEAIRVKGQAMLAVSFLGEEIALRLGPRARSGRRPARGVDRVLDQAAAIACSRAGISVADYRKIHRNDLQLMRAQQRAIDHALIAS